MRRTRAVRARHWLRQCVVRWRHPHRKAVKHYDAPGHLHELTFSCYLRKPLLTNDCWRRVFADNVQAACQSERFGLLAFVFMPEHVHLLIEPQAADSQVSRFLALSKQPTSKSIKRLLVASRVRLLDDLTVQERPGRTCFHFWQEGGGYDRNLFTARAIEASLDYVHTNPVSRGLVEKAADWKWSSARFHYLREVDPDLPELSRIDPRWLDRSGVQAEHS